MPALWLALALAAPALTGSSRVRAADDPFWSAHVEPLLRERCGECHNPTKSKSGLDLSTLQPILRGGEHGAAVLPGRPDASNLIKFLAPGSDPHMPPKGQLTGEQVDVLKTWIAKLAAVPVPPAPDPAPPPSRAVAPIWVPPATLPAPQVIDHFVELGWKERHVRPSPTADDATFLRRLHLDLVGRVPTTAESARFLADHHRDKRARLVDELLAIGAWSRPSTGPRALRHPSDPDWRNQPLADSCPLRT